MKKFIKLFKNKNADKLNMKLIKRQYEEELVDFVVEVFKSLETIRMITFLGYDVEYDESKIDMSKYITSRKKKKKKDKNIKYHYIKSDRCFELTMRFRVDVKDETSFVTKSILLPKKDSNNYYTLKDKKYFLLYQLVDSSTYVSKNGLTLKSLMPIVNNKRETSLVDCKGDKYTFTSYYMKVFKRDISVLLFYFSKMGFINGLKYFMVDKIMNVQHESDADDADNIYFVLNKNLFLKVNKKFFDKFDYVKAMCGMISDCFAPKTDLDDLEYQSYWVERLGALYTATPHKRYDSGKSTITFFERLLDLTTKKKLKVSEINKMSIYSVVRWILQNFSDLRNKNNLDLSTKRLRLNEYIASMLSMKIGDGVNRILTQGNRVTLKQVLNIFKFPGTIVINALQTSQLLKFDDRVNDLDIFSALRYTVKGPNSLGNKSDRNIDIKLRGVHPSYLGNIDINVYSSSSPGLSGCCTPFANTHGLYFDDKPEPQNQEYELFNEIAKTEREKGYLVVKLGDDPITYYDTKLKLLQNEIKGFDFKYVLDKNDKKLYVILGSQDERELL